MATSNQCSVCGKGPGTCLCTGCKAYFCRKHFNDHHAILLSQLDGYMEEHNALHEKINKTNYNDESRNTILLQIDEWQRTTVEKVIQAAELARQQVKLPTSKRLKIMIRLGEFSNKLGHLKETEDFVENDLTQLEEILHTLKQDLKELAKLSSVELHIEQSEQIAWNHLIYVKEKATTTEDKQDQQGAKHHLLTIVKPDQRCRFCGKIATEECTECFNVFYCSIICQKRDIFKHGVNCIPTRTLNSAEYLVQAAVRDLLPDDPDTLNDFGFSKCLGEHDREKLLGLYQGVIKALGVGSKELHQWQQANELALHIQKRSEDARERLYTGYYWTLYYVWFLKNQHLVDSRTPNTEICQHVRKYLSVEDKDKDIPQLEPVAKRTSIGLYVVLLENNVPRIDQEIWIDFGFCTCNNQALETELGRVYRALMDQCSLYEFYTNYASASLEALLRSKNIDGIDSIKMQGVVFGSPSISAYYLKQYVLAENAHLQHCVKIDYGFDFCTNKKQKQKLKKIYKQLFEHPHFDILSLHKACIAGTIYKYASQFVKADANLMRNLYPLP